MVLPSGEDRTRDLEWKIRAAHVRQRVAVGERVTDHSADERVHLDLVVVLVEGEREIHRQPDKPRVVRALYDCTHRGSDGVEPRRERGRGAGSRGKRDA